MRSLSASEGSSMTTPPSAMLPQPAIRSPWHSPVPYLFGGLAAMLALIAFALLILACSYWRLSTRRRRRQGGDVESGDEKEGKPVEKKVFEEKFLVIMAGDNQPTFLATPASNRVSVCGCGDAIAVGKDGGEMGSEGKVKQGLYEHGEPTTAAEGEEEEEEEEENGSRETMQN
ncbi:unnamed protein product [Linum trigynum]|uniref:Uncharacterized protein n=1 Tax=Linum trigynum TaxID=586398 RepID=A0AAV2EHD2_9ROSI